jgi:hypothetical protein
MKFLKIGLIILALLALAFFGMRMYTKSHSPAEKVEYSKGDLSMKVNYCRPYMKGREIFGGIVPYGKVWRTGANEPTTIEFSKDVDFNGNAVKAGKYSLWTIPNADKWAIVLNKEIPAWGTMHKPENDLLKTDVPVGQALTESEQLTIIFVDQDSLSNLNIRWASTDINVPIR